MNTPLTIKDLNKLPAAELKDLAKRGILTVMTQRSLSDLKYTDLPQYKKHSKWKGIKITMREASRLFDIPHQTISRWVSKNYITVLEHKPREVYLDKADVAYCAEILHERSGSGKWLFNSDRTPYVPLTRQAS
jgi:hypothetical protein